MSGIGPTELVVILVIGTLLYALGRLPEFGGALGKGIGKFGQAGTVGKPESTIANDDALGTRVHISSPKN